MRPNTHPEVDALLTAGAAVAVGVSGGKDSHACALAVARHLDRIGHDGPRILIHADLGMVEWKDSLPSCERLADHIGWELVVVRRQAGGMMERWEKRWANNVDRYRALDCVKLILPWSTPSMRFCTSELKVQVISPYLRRRFAGRDVINVTGIRRQESSNRAKAPVAVDNPAIVKAGGRGMTWNAIIEHDVDRVFEFIRACGMDLHEGYTKYGMSWISCAFCIMSNARDLLQSTTCADNLPVYQRMVDLEAASTFAFQGNQWLGDVAPYLLGADRWKRLQAAKEAAAIRTMWENRIPRHLLYTAGWPTCMPTPAEAALIADVRSRVAQVVGLGGVGFLTATEISRRYAELLETRP